ERLKRRHVRLPQVALVRMNVEKVTIGFWAAMNRVVLRGRIDFAILRIVALQTLDEFDAHQRGEKRILAVRLLTAAPARIAENVDVRRPERESLIAVALFAACELMMLRAALVADRGRHFAHEVRIERGCEADRLRE